jgi:hypothetical protein
LNVTVTLVDSQDRVSEPLPLSRANVVDFADLRSARKIVTHKHQKHLPGYYWFSSIDTLVPYESRLEMFTLMDLDFSGQVVRVLAQPLIFHFRQRSRTVRHVPDFLICRSGGALSLIDVKRRAQGERPDIRRVFEWTEGACSRLGWGYEVRHEPDEVYLSNLKWLAGYRRRPAKFGLYAEPLLQLCAECSSSVRELVSIAAPVLVRPSLFHLLWLRFLAVDMTKPLDNATSVHLAARA